MARACVLGSLARLLVKLCLLEVRGAEPRWVLWMVCH